MMQLQGLFSLSLVAETKTVSKTIDPPRLLFPPPSLLSVRSLGHVTSHQVRLRMFHDLKLIVRDQPFEKVNSNLRLHFLRIQPGDLKLYLNLALMCVFLF